MKAVREEKSRIKERERVKALFWVGGQKLEVGAEGRDLRIKD